VNYLCLSPALKQVFYIGDGLISGSVAQWFPAEQPGCFCASWTPADGPTMVANSRLNRRLCWALSGAKATELPSRPKNEN